MAGSRKSRTSCGTFLWLGVRRFATPWTAALQASLSFTISQSFLKLMSVESMMPSNHLILCRPLLLLPSIFLSIRVFSSESGSSHQVAKILELQLQRQCFQWVFQCWFPLGLTGLISLQSKGLSRVFSTIVGELFTSPKLQFLHLEKGSSSTYSVWFFFFFYEKKNECNVLDISSLNINLKKDSLRIQSIR